MLPMKIGARLRNIFFVQSSGAPDDVANSHSFTRPVCFSRGWLIAAALLALQYALFLEYARREVLWGYPAYTDQGRVLAQSYEIFDVALKDGFWAGLKRASTLGLAQGRLIPTQAALLYFMLGPSRLSALTLNFLYFAVLQVVLVSTLLNLTRNWNIALIGLALLLTTNTRYFWVGGLMDFRLDFINFCLYGIFVILVLRSRLFLSLHWSVMSGLVGGVLIWCRQLMAPVVFSVSAFSILSVYFTTRSEVKCAISTHAARIKLRNSLIVFVFIFVLSAPGILPGLTDIYRYYIGEVTRGSGSIRTSEFGIKSPLAFYGYYAGLLLVDHLGYAFMGVLACIIALLLHIILRERGIQGGQTALSTDLDIRGSVHFCLLCLLVPLAILTIYPIRSPILSNVLVVPSLCIAIFGMIAFVGCGNLTGGPGPRVLQVLSFLLVVVAVCFEFTMARRPGPFTGDPGAAKAVVGLIDEVLLRCQKFGVLEPKVAFDRMRDYMNGSLLAPMAYERHRLLLRPIFLLPRDINWVTEESERDALTAIQDADFAFIRTGVASATYGFDYPFNDGMRSIQSKVLQAAREDLDYVSSISVHGEEILLFCRPMVQLTGVSGGWITSQGVDLTVASQALRKRPRIVLSGNSILADQVGPDPGAHAVVRVPGRESPYAAMVETKMNMMSNGRATYEMSLMVEPFTVPQSGDVVIHLTFDRHVVPSEISSSGDHRRLVIQAPNRIRLETAAR